MNDNDKKLDSGFYLDVVRDFFPISTDPGALYFRKMSLNLYSLLYLALSKGGYSVKHRDVGIILLNASLLESIPSRPGIMDTPEAIDLSLFLDKYREYTGNGMRLSQNKIQDSFGFLARKLLESSGIT